MELTRVYRGAGGKGRRHKVWYIEFNVCTSISKVPSKHKEYDRLGGWIRTIRVISG